MPVKSYCAENDGTAGQYIETPEITVDVRDGILLECEAYYTQTSGYGTLFDFGRVGNDRLGFIVKGTQIIYFFIDESGDTVIDNTTPLSYNNQYLEIAFYVSSTEYYFSINGTIIDSGTITTNSTTITQKSYFCCRLGTLPLTGKVWNCKINGGAILNIPLQGSCYDISGNGNHGTNNGVDLTAVQDEFHYNLRKGFGQGASSDFIPRLADNSGFPVTVAEEHLAGTWSNMSESYFRFKDALTSDIMDKSNVDVWSADVRSSVYYDSSNPRDWHSSELIQEYLDDNINPTYKNRVFVADNNTTFVKDGSDWVVNGDDYLVEFGDGATQGKQILIYNTQQTGKDLEKIIKFLSKEY